MFGRPRRSKRIEAHLEAIVERLEDLSARIEKLERHYSKMAEASTRLHQEFCDEVRIKQQKLEAYLDQFIQKAANQPVSSDSSRWARRFEERSNGTTEKPKTIDVKAGPVGKLP